MPSPTAGTPTARAAGKPTSTRLHAALAKVEQLRGVSYELRDSGKHEIGVIAEEVGKVVPEVVSYEKNGADAQGVDYGRLTALLIEATTAVCADRTPHTASEDNPSHSQGWRTKWLRGSHGEGGGDGGSAVVARKGRGHVA